MEEVFADCLNVIEMTMAPPQDVPQGMCDYSAVTIHYKVQR